MFTHLLKLKYTHNVNNLQNNVQNDHSITVEKYVQKLIHCTQILDFSWELLYIFSKSIMCRWKIRFCNVLFHHYWQRANCEYWSLKIGTNTWQHQDILESKFKTEKLRFHILYHKTIIRLLNLCALFFLLYVIGYTTSLQNKYSSFNGLCYCRLVRERICQCVSERESSSHYCTCMCAGIISPDVRQSWHVCICSLICSVIII